MVSKQRWIKLEVLKATVYTVTLKHFILIANFSPNHHEHSTFKLEDGSWFYVDGHLLILNFY
jgi:SEC-C motif-containing protein